MGVYTIMAAILSKVSITMGSISNIVLYTFRYPQRKFGAFSKMCTITPIFVTIRPDYRYGINSPIFANESLCRPIRFCSLMVRSALKAKKIQPYHLWKAKLSIKLNGNDFVISHIDDRIDLNLAEPEDRLSIMK